MTRRRVPLVRALEDQYVLVDEETGQIVYQDFIHAAGSHGEWEGTEASLEAACEAQFSGYAIGLWTARPGKRTYDGKRRVFA